MQTLRLKFMESRNPVSTQPTNHSSHSKIHLATFVERLDPGPGRDSKQQSRRATLLEHQWILSSVS